jgi:hypothetical protein
MFSVVNVREGISADDYGDPGWYENPPGTQAWEWIASRADQGRRCEDQVTPKDPAQQSHENHQ